MSDLRAMVVPEHLRTKIWKHGYEPELQKPAPADIPPGPTYADIMAIVRATPSAPLPTAQAQGGFATTDIGSKRTPARREEAQTNSTQLALSL
jgi:hypothetical protein